MGSLYEKKRIRSLLNTIHTNSKWIKDLNTKGKQRKNEENEINVLKKAHSKWTEMTNMKYTNMDTKRRGRN